jgi:peroxiredoxin
MSAKSQRRQRQSRTTRAARAAHPSLAARSVVHPVVRRAESAARQSKPRPGRYQQLERQRRNGLILKIAGGVIGAIVVLGVIYFMSNSGGLSGGTSQQKQYRYDIASPKTGALAPDFTLPSTTGGTVRLSDLKGKNVLLYFQEGIGCEGCWTQLKDIQSDMGRFQQLGISDVITITTNPLDALKQKVADETITLPVLSDESFAASRAYNATMYGMMAGSADGHTFILVGPDGRIRWRADYGGPPEYTMYVPISSLIADIKAGANDK